MQEVHFAWAPMFVILFAVIAVIALVLTGLIALVRNPKTRVFGIMLLLTMPLAMVAVVIGFLFYARSEAHTASVQYPPSGSTTIRMDDGRQLRRVGQDRWEVIEPASVRGDPSASPTITVPPKPQTTTRALAKSLVDTFRNQTRERQEAIKRQANKALAATIGSTTPSESKTADSDQAGEIDLSGKPASADPRPDWLDRPPRVSEGSFQEVVTVGPLQSPSECEQSLTGDVERETNKFIAKYLGIDEKTAQQIQLPPDVLQKKIVKATYAEWVQTSYGRWVRLHALLEFDRDVRNQVDQQWHHLRVNQRVWRTSGGLAGMLLFLSIAWGYLRIDTATGGAYRNRLRALAAVLVVALAAAGLALPH